MGGGGTAEKEKRPIPLRVCGKVVILRHKTSVRGYVPNFWEVTDYMTERTSDHGRSKRKRGTVKLGQIFILSLQLY